MKKYIQKKLHPNLKTEKFSIFYFSKAKKKRIMEFLEDLDFDKKKLKKKFSNGVPKLVMRHW
jgi:hypothetical protein